MAAAARQAAAAALAVQELADVETLLGRVGFTIDAITACTTTQGLINKSLLRELEDDEVTNLCKVIRRPGGMVASPMIPGPWIPDPTNAGGTIPGPMIPGPMVQNYGTPVSLIAENNLKLLCYYLRWLERTSKTMTVRTSTLARWKVLETLKKSEEEHKDPDAPDINDRDWPRTIEAMEEYFASCLGTTKIPLGYVIRRELVATATPADGWTTEQVEMIARAPIVVDPAATPLEYLPVFKVDNKLLWLKLAAMTRDKLCWTYVRPHQRAQDGRKGFWALYDHYLGPSNVDHMAARAEGKLQTTTYTGETKRWNFERYIAMHVDQHTILQGLTMYGYSGIDPRSKVRYLMQGIKTTTLDSVKASVMSNPTLRNDFDATAGLYKDYIDQIKATQPTREAHVAALESGGKDKRKSSGDGGDPFEGIKPDMSMADRYYSAEEYGKLTPEQKAGIFRKRQTRDSGGNKGKKDGNSRIGKGGRNTSSGKSSATKKTQFSKASIKAIAKKVAFLQQEEADDEEDADDHSMQSADNGPKKQKIINNRTNSALKRGRKD